MEQTTAQTALGVDPRSHSFLGRWQRLISTTNWEKGRIILEWRAALVAAGAGSGEYSDEAWSLIVGQVSGQHVGRLRRVGERFGDTHDSYPGLFWSHFQAAVDWNDAEMWLEGAVQNGWSINQMRAQRWQARGGDTNEAAAEVELAATEWDEDGGTTQVEGANQRVVQPVAGAPDLDWAPEGDADSESASSMATPADREHDGFADEPATAPPAAPFRDLVELPADLAEPFEGLKLAIIHHKLGGWAEISCAALLDSLDALKALAVTPT